MIDGDDVLRFANAAAGRILDVEIDRVIGTPLASFVPAATAAELAAHAHAVRASLLALRARAAPSPAARRADLDAARAGFARAFEINPLLKKEYSEVVQQVEAGGAAR